MSLSDSLLLVYIDMGLSGSLQLVYTDKEKPLWNTSASLYREERL